MKHLLYITLLIVLGTICVNCQTLTTLPMTICGQGMNYNNIMQQSYIQNYKFGLCNCNLTYTICSTFNGTQIAESNWKDLAERFCDCTISCTTNYKTCSTPIDNISVVCSYDSTRCNSNSTMQCECYRIVQ